MSFFFFYEQELTNLTSFTSFGLVQILVAHANEKGFQLIKVKSEENKVYLSCCLKSTIKRLIEYKLLAFYKQ